MQLAKQIVYKEMFLSLEELESVGNEAGGVIDFLVMRHAHKVVGVNASTFSVSLQEYRALDGVPPNDTWLVKIPPKAARRARRRKKAAVRRPERRATRMLFSGAVGTVL
jgi:hypothetical protein